MTKNFFKPLAAALATFVLCAPGAIAQDAAPLTDGRSFEPGYFDQYAPRSALDMLSRIPGFQLDGGNSQRGLGQGGANVLINGQRLTGKSSDPFELVSLISAKNVVKIDIVDGASLNIPGLSGQVANVTTKSTGITGTWEWQPEMRNRLQTNWFQGFITISGEQGNLAYTAKLKSDARHNGHWGPEERRDSAGNLFELRDERASYDAETPGASVSLTWTPKAEHIGNFNAEYNQYNSNNTVISDLTASTDRGENARHISSSAEDEWNMKIDGDYEFPVGPGKLKMTGYYRGEHSPTFNRFDVYDVRDGLIESTRFFRVADEGEAIARSEYSWSAKDNQDWQVSAEGAFNFLDIDSQFVDLILPDNSSGIDNSRVEEKRAEATATHSRALSPKWDIQLSLGGEFSQLSQGTLVREFFRPKGFVNATYKPQDNFSIRTRLEREVGQLNFFDFISSVSLDDNLNTTGNPDLVPEQSWEAEVEFDRQFTGGNSFKARFYGELISDLVDRIPLGIDGDAVGNIDSAHRYGIDMNATLKGDNWGLNGTELNLELDFRDSSVTDPVEGFKRRLNDDKKYYWSVEFRHDIPDTEWAYGFYADQFKESAVYRLNTINQFTFDGPFGQVYIEHKDIFGMKVNLALRNIFDASDDFYREVYTDRRDLGVLDFTEDRTRPFGHFLRLTVSGTF